jgi:hypothetical protein
MYMERVGFVMLGCFKGVLSERGNVNGNGHCRRNTIIQIIVATIAFIILVRIYPFAVVESHKTSKQQAYDKTALKELSGDEFTSDDKKLQTVYFSNDHIYQVKLYMSVDFPGKVSNAQYVTFRIYDETFSCVSSEDVSLFKIEKKGYLKATPDIDVEVGRPYYYEILVPEQSEAHIELPTASKDTLNQAENSLLYIDGIGNDEVCLVADFDYAKPLTAAGILLRYVMVIALSVLIYVGIIYLIDFFEERFWEYNDRLRKISKIVLSIAVVLVGCYIIINSVILNIFGSSTLDRAVYLVAVLVGIFWSLGAMWLVRYYPKARRDYSRSLIWKNYIQTVSFGLLFYALCQYVNADREFYHYTNTRWMLIFLAIAFLTLINGTAVMNKLSFAWIILGWICSALYSYSFKGDDEDFLLARLTCGVVVAWGLFILNLIIIYVKQGKRATTLSIAAVKFYVASHKLQVFYTVLWVVFIILMYKYRFEKVWVFTATLPFASLFFVKLTPQVKSRLLRNLTNGIILSFWMVVVFCLHHRPHYYWMLYRYGGIFHTVACTGMYLAVVFAAALGKLYGLLKDRKNMFLRCYYEFLLIGCIVGFLILTMSRTAFLTITVCTILVLALSAYTYRKGIKRIIQELSLLAVTVVACFPLVFTVVRMIPAVVNEPVSYSLELTDDEWGINIGEPIYSENYMNMERFLILLFSRFAKSDGTAGEVEAVVDNTELLAFNSNEIRDVQILNYTDGDRNYEIDTDNDVSNGRFDIFLSYIKEIGFKGHPGMALNVDGTDKYGHAHNSYLQISYNFGIIAGVVFLIICVISLWKSANIAIRQGRKYNIYFVPFALIVAFGLISLTEWAFHPCIPAGFCFLLMQPLLIKEG